MHSFRKKKCLSKEKDSMTVETKTVKIKMNYILNLYYVSIKCRPTRFGEKNVSTKKTL